MKNHFTAQLLPNNGAAALDTQAARCRWNTDEAMRSPDLSAISMNDSRLTGAYLTGYGCIAGRLHTIPQALHSNIIPTYRFRPID